MMSGYDCASKQSQKTRMHGNHEHCAYVNNSGFDDVIRRMLIDGLSPDMMHELELDPDFKDHGRVDAVSRQHDDSMYTSKVTCRSRTSERRESS